jgi:hypothetical protein
MALDTGQDAKIKRDFSNEMKNKIKIKNRLKKN